MKNTASENCVTFVSTMEGVPWGGSEELWAGAALHLRKMDWRVSICVKEWPKPVPQLQRVEREGCAIFRRQTDTRFRRLLPTFRSFDRTAKWLCRQTPDLVVISQGGVTDGLAWAERCFQLGLPYALLVQAAAAHAWPRSSFLERLQNAYASAARCYFVSKENREIVETMLGCTLATAKIVWNPFTVRYEPQASTPLPSLPYRLACVARMDPSQKGQDVLLRVMAMPKWRDRELYVDFIGAGAYERQLRALADRLKLTKVNWLGHQNNIEAVWTDHHALILPSRFEGMPLALIEAMLCGRPSIVTDVGGNADIVEELVTGFIAGAATVPLLDEAMERAWQHRANWPQMGLTAAERIRQAVSADPCGDFAKDIASLISNAQ